MGEESPKGYMKQRWIELDGGKDLRGAGMKELEHRVTGSERELRDRRD